MMASEGHQKEALQQCVDVRRQVAWAIPPQLIDLDPTLQLAETQVLETGFQRARQEC